MLRIPAVSKLISDSPPMLARKDEHQVVRSGRSDWVSHASHVTSKNGEAHSEYLLAPWKVQTLAPRKDDRTRDGRKPEADPALTES